MACYWKVRISFLEVSVNVFGFIWFVYFVLFVLVCLGFDFFFSLGTCLETGFRTGGSLGFYLLINFPVEWT